jgi:hypothetical protein
MQLTSNLKHTILIFVAVILFIYFLKPRFIYKPNGLPRTYGFGYDDDGYKKTVYSLNTTVLFIAIILYYLLN